MPQLSPYLRFASGIRFTALFGVVIASPASAVFAWAGVTQQTDQPSGPTAGMPDGKMTHMSGHMYMTSLRPPNA
ncbi:MAG: hypothetical protein WBX22_23550, partial [Silvibacterium sp.]